MRDTLAEGQPFRVLRVLDQWSRQSPLREVGTRMSTWTGGQAFDRVWDEVPEPRSILVAHETKFQPRELEAWTYRRGVRLDFIRPGKPVENAFIESFNERLRDGCLNVHQFTSLAEAQTIIEAWRLDYNARRPHSSLVHLTPNEFVGRRGALQTFEEVVTSPRKTTAGYNWSTMAASAVPHDRSGPMKRSKFLEEQIVYAIRQAEAGTSVGDLCRQFGVNEAPFYTYTWKKKEAHLGVSELRRLRQLEEENS